MLNAEYVIMAHNHPTIRFVDDLGYRSAEPAWIRTGVRRNDLAFTDRYHDHDSANPRS
jgi:metallophosphoesterase superfamily enzyme